MAVLTTGVRSWAVVVENGRLTCDAVDRSPEFIIHGAGTGCIEVGSVIRGMKTDLGIRAHSERAGPGDVHEQVGSGAGAGLAELGLVKEADTGPVE